MELDISTMLRYDTTLLFVSHNTEEGRLLSNLFSFFTTSVLLLESPISRVDHASFWSPFRAASLRKASY